LVPRIVMSTTCRPSSTRLAVTSPVRMWLSPM
jgi:hypothetical protein